MEHDIMISIADFSKYPSGRDKNDGTFNGTDYRQDVLLPAIEQALASHSKVRVSLVDVMSFGSSFLEEAFGGLVRVEGIGAADLEKVLIIESGKTSFSRYENAIWKYIQDAR